jgi:hypothetical protein
MIANELLEDKIILLCEFLLVIFWQLQNGKLFGKGVEIWGGTWRETV